MADMKRLITDEQIDLFLDSYNPAIREHDGRTFAIEVANAQRDLTNKDWEQVLISWKGLLELVMLEHFAGRITAKTEGKILKVLKGIGISSDALESNSRRIGG